MYIWKHSWPTTINLYLCDLVVGCRSPCSIDIGPNTTNRALSRFPGLLLLTTWKERGTLRKTYMAPEKLEVGGLLLFSLWDGFYSGAMLVFAVQGERKRCKLKTTLRKQVKKRFLRKLHKAGVFEKLNKLGCFIFKELVFFQKSFWQHLPNTYCFVFWKTSFFSHFSRVRPQFTDRGPKRFPKGKPDEASDPPKDCTCQSLRLFDASKILHQLGC